MIAQDQDPEVEIKSLIGVAIRNETSLECRPVGARRLPGLFASSQNQARRSESQRSVLKARSPCNSLWFGLPAIMTLLTKS
jgi:hypothetical protein